MIINVIGLGYVGLTLALTLADVGFKVKGIEKDSKKIEMLKQGKSPLYEEQIEQLLKSTIKSQNITFSDKIENSDNSTYIIAVGTPIDNNTHEPILDNLKNVATEVGKNLKKDELVILRSTVPISTTRNIVKPILEKESGLSVSSDFSLAFAPERTLQGKALKELRELSQIIGGIDQKSVEKASEIFNKLTRTIVRVSSLEAAELIKLLDNTYRDITISIGNLVGKICEKTNLDSREVIESANYGYTRNKILFPGAGVGGGCLVKDPYLLISSLGDKLNLDLVKNSRKINDSMIEDTIKLINRVFGDSRNISESRVLVLGFAFKGTPDTDDIRYSPTLPIIEYLQKNKVKIFGYDPNVPKETINGLGVEYVPEIYNKIDYDCIIIMNNNPKFRDINFEKIQEKLDKKLIVIDGWYMYDRKYLKNLGIEYFALGS